MSKRDENAFENGHERHRVHAAQVGHASTRHLRCDVTDVYHLNLLLFLLGCHCVQAIIHALMLSSKNKIYFFFNKLKMHYNLVLTNNKTANVSFTAIACYSTLCNARNSYSLSRERSHLISVIYLDIFVRYSQFG